MSNEKVVLLSVFNSMIDYEIALKRARLAKMPQELSIYELQARDLLTEIESFEEIRDIVNKL
jgi:hypothetical protein